MSEPSTELTKALSLLSSGEVMPSNLAEQVFSELNRVLRSEDAEIDWDDAWDALELLGSQHTAGLSFLCGMLRERGNSSSRDNYARVWAIKAIAKIGGDSGEVVPVLTALLKDESRNVRNEASAALRKRGCNHL